MRRGHVRPRRSWTGLLLCLLLLAFCGFVHFLACERMELRHAFALLDGKAIRRMALIDFVSAHPELAAGYAVLFASVIVHGVWRRHPRWARYAAFAGMGSPCLVYLNVCVHISSKIVMWGGVPAGWR